MDTISLCEVEQEARSARVFKALEIADMMLDAHVFGGCKPYLNTQVKLAQYSDLRAAHIEAERAAHEALDQTPSRAQAGAEGDPSPPTARTAPALHIIDDDESEGMF